MADEFDSFIKALVNKASCGIGYVIVPPDVERGDYIDSCFRTETVSISPALGGTSYNNVPLALCALQDIEFPEDSSSIGSQVVFLFHPAQHSPIIIAVVNKSNELKGVGWKQFYFNKENDGDYVHIKGDARKGFLIAEVKSTASGGGIIKLNLLKGDSTGQLSIYVQGDISVVANNITVRAGSIEINGGENLGLVNIKSLRGALEAIQQDLIVAQSGTQLTKWYAADDGAAALEDTKVIH